MFYPYNESQGIKAHFCHIRKENHDYDTKSQNSNFKNHNYDDMKSQNYDLKSQNMTY